MNRKKNIFYKIYNRTYKLWTPFRVIRNMVITWRYPWLTVYDWRNSKVCRTSIWATPHDGGWNRAFFYQMMEDIRKVAKRDGVFKKLSTADYKSKYGGLRFYVDGATNEINSIIHQYECLSQYICECCGEPDVGCTKGWITPICRKCYEKYYGNSDSYNEYVGEGRMPDYYKFRRFELVDEESKEYAIDIRDKADKIRRRWNRWHPTRRKIYSEDK